MSNEVDARFSVVRALSGEYYILQSTVDDPDYLCFSERELAVTFDYDAARAAYRLLAEGESL